MQEQYVYVIQEIMKTDIDPVHPIILSHYTAVADTSENARAIMIARAVKTINSVFIDGIDNIIIKNADVTRQNIKKCMDERIHTILNSNYTTPVGTINKAWALQADTDKIRLWEKGNSRQNEYKIRFVRLPILTKEYVDGLE